MPKRRDYSKYDPSVYKVVKQVRPDASISSKAMASVCSMVRHFLDRLGREAAELVELNKRLTLDSRDIQTAVRLVLPGELAKHAVSEGTKAITSYNANDNGAASKRARIVFPIPRITRRLRRVSGRLRVSPGAGVYLAAVLEYLTAEIVELAGNSARDNRRKRIIPRDLELGIGNDEELNKLILSRGGVIPYGGVIPHIASVLLPRDRKKSP